jgi:uncharacterized protein YdaU (DUF1376 family)
MAKAPAFQFYASDFLTDTQSWEAFEVGVYIRLLSNQWVNGSLPSDLKRLSRIAGCEYQEMEKAWVILGFKFLDKNDGTIINQKLESVRADKNRFIEKQHQNGLKGGRPLKIETQTKPKDNPKETQTITQSITQTKPLQSSTSIKEIINKDFDLFWVKYPKKVAKEDCSKLFKKLSNEDQSQILNTIDKFISYKPFDSYNHPNPKTYLNQRRWEDVIEVKTIEIPKHYFVAP